MEVHEGVGPGHLKELAPFAAGPQHAPNPLGEAQAIACEKGSNVNGQVLALGDAVNAVGPHGVGTLDDYAIIPETNTTLVNGHGWTYYHAKKNLGKGRVAVFRDSHRDDYIPDKKPPDDPNTVEAMEYQLDQVSDIHFKAPLVADGTLDAVIEVIPDKDLWTGQGRKDISRRLWDDDGRVRADYLWEMPGPGPGEEGVPIIRCRESEVPAIVKELMGETPATEFAQRVLHLIDNDVFMADTLASVSRGPLPVVDYYQLEEFKRTQDELREMGLGRAASIVSLTGCARQEGVLEQFVNPDCTQYLAQETLLEMARGHATSIERVVPERDGRTELEAQCSDRVLRSYALPVIALYGDERAERFLEGAAKSDSFEVRADAAMALPLLRTPRADELLEGLLEDDSFIVRSAAVKGYVRRNGGASVDRMRQMFTQEMARYDETMRDPVILAETGGVSFEDGTPQAHLTVLDNIYIELYNTRDAQAIEFGRQVQDRTIGLWAEHDPGFTE